MEKGWESAAGEHPAVGKAKGPLCPDVTLCRTVLTVALSVERDSMARGGPVRTTAPPENSLILSRSLAKRAHRGQRSPSSSAISCSPHGAMHPLPRRRWGAPMAPSRRGLEMGCLRAPSAFSSFNPEALGGFLWLSPSRREPGTPLLSSAAASPASAPAAPSLSAQGCPAASRPLHATLGPSAAPTAVWGHGEATLWAVTVTPPPPQGRKQGDGGQSHTPALSEPDTGPPPLSPEGGLALLPAPPQKQTAPAGAAWWFDPPTTFPNKGHPHLSKSPRRGLSPARACSAPPPRHETAILPPEMPLPPHPPGSSSPRE